MLIIKRVLLLILQVILLVDSHIMKDRAHLGELKKICDHAYTCFHDMIIVCGTSINEAKTFLDLCDLYEYSCETSIVFRHVKEQKDVCPTAFPPGFG